MECDTEGDCPSLVPSSVIDTLQQVFGRARHVLVLPPPSRVENQIHMQTSPKFVIGPELVHGHGFPHSSEEISFGAQLLSKGKSGPCCGDNVGARSWASFYSREVFQSRGWDLATLDIYTAKTDPQ